MKTFLAFLAFASAACAQVVQGPAYIARAQVVTVTQGTTLTAPTPTAFPVDAFVQTDLGTIDGSGNQTVISSTPWIKISFDMLDATHATKTVSWTFNSVTYTMPYAAFVSGLGAVVAQETPTPPSH